SVKAKHIEVSGQVQGTGFRPYVFGLAQQYGLSGTVRNTTSGVCIHVEGPEFFIRSFLSELPETPPPLARIEKVLVEDASLEREKGFSIKTSGIASGLGTLVSPDTAPCEKCMEELLDPTNRRYGYPFINCTHCGPRFTIIHELPYDRPGTSMRDFPLCGPCRSEYENPRDRRFHAQPIACEKCGPGVFLLDAHGKTIPVADPISEAGNLLAAGKVLAIKGLGGFHLAVDARNSRAVSELRRRKNRPRKPLAVMVEDIARAESLARINGHLQKTLLDRRRPIVLLEKNSGFPLSPEIAPGLSRVGVMLPYTPLHHLIMNHVPGGALVMTSANKPGEPIIKDNDEAISGMTGIADAFLVNDRDIVARCDDSVLMPREGGEMAVRLGRGFAPLVLEVPLKGPAVLALGGQQKNSVCLLAGGRAHLSQHVGDLDSPAAVKAFEHTIRHLCRLHGVRPEVVAHDLHPDYAGTRYAKSLPGVTTLAVQHHLAHILSCLAENKHHGPVVGLAFDGAGWGPDQAIWGGEVLVCRWGSPDFIRAAHLSYLAQPGGDAAAREPWRMAVSHLFNAFGPDFKHLELDLLHDLEPEKTAFLTRMIEKKVHCPQTSSMGRLFDAVAALCGLSRFSTFEGQAAMELEALADRDSHAGYPVSWDPGSLPEIPVAPIIQGVAEDLLEKSPPSVVAARFQATIAELFSGVCGFVAEKHGIEHVALSGGVFQNRQLTHLMIRNLSRIGLKVLTHSKVPPNDGGLCLGQAVAAAST
ncbi:MAG: carbamoyltransferase HypF, partial [Pseudomonadota bacterium]